MEHTPQLPIDPELLITALREGDTVIRRVRNGWILLEATHDRGLQEVGVFEEPESYQDNVSEAEALSNLLWEAFESYFQSKWRGGMVIQVAEKGREVQNEE